MYSVNQHHKRRKKRMLQGSKTVTVVRGKLGYGFTISGQNPCMLSCIVPGSPAEAAGLKPGDLLYYVNGQNVSRHCHDDVVRMVGLSTGALDLQVAENCNSSDSSDDDYLPRSKSRYPNRVRHRQNVGDKLSRNDVLFRQPAAEAGSDLSSSLTSQEEPSWVPSATERRYVDYPHDRGNHRRHQRGPVISTAQKITSSSAVVKKVPPVVDVLKMAPSSSRQAKFKDTNEASSVEMRRPPPQFHHPQMSRSAPSPVITTEGEMEEEELPEVAESVRAVVGYIGSIETPSSHTRPHQRLQALRNAVRRLRVEQRVHTLVLMTVDKSGVCLTNTQGKQLAVYPTDNIAFSGICPDDKRFFGLVTLSMPDDDCSSYRGQGDTARTAHSSCHIFMIEPDLSPHSAHVHQAEMFQIVCTTNPKTRRCDEFPMSATSLILCVANLYRDSPPKRFDAEIVQSQALADPVGCGGGERNQSSGSNNSDSGLGFGKEEAPLEQNEQVCVVDLPPNEPRLDTSGMSVAMETSTGSLSFQPQLSPEVDVIGTPRHPNSTQRSLSAFDIRRGLNNSTSSEEWQHSRLSSHKLTPRAMPDPASLKAARSPESCPISSKGNAESLRLSMQRLLQARQQQLQEQNLLLESDGESHNGGEPILSLSVAENGHALLECNPGATGVDSFVKEEKEEPVFAVPTHPAPGSHHYSGRVVRSAFQVPRPVSAPIDKRRSLQSRPEMVDMDTMGKLSPRAFPHTSPTSSSAFRSPSAPPAPFFPHQDSDDDDDDDDDDESEDDPYIRQILDQFSRDRQAALDEDSRRYSEGFALSKRREKEKQEAVNVQKWTKAGSFRRKQHAMLKQSFSQSHESLAVGDEANLSQQHKLITANSVNNITRQNGTHGVQDKGRVAGWAVNFDRLLRDPVGIELFTEFLEKEYSQENIIFWKACEQFKLPKDEHQMRLESQEIYGRFLSPKASDPVNVDSAARACTEKFLNSPSSVMFDVPQQQIYQLMRQDSYGRFLKSEVYKRKLMDEMEGKPLVEAPGEEMSSGPDKPDGGGKKKVKGKENEDKRRRSILPWKQSKKSTVKSTSDSELKRNGKKGGSKEEKEPAGGTNLDTSILGGGVVSTKPSGSMKKAPGPGIDLSTMRKEVFHPKESKDIPEAQFKFCRIVMPDGSTTVVCAKPGQSSRLVLSKLCEKRNLSIASVDVFLLGSDRPLDLNEDISTLGSKEIVIERRVLFRLDLPNGKSIGVKAKPNRSIRDVFRPILNKYGYRVDNVAVTLASCTEFLDLDVPVSELDNHRAVVLESATVAEMTWRGLEPPLSARGSKATLPPPPPPPQHAGRGGKGEQSGSLEEITNKIFEDLMRGKSQLAHGFDELGVLELDHRAKVLKNDEVHFSGLFGLLRRESLGQKDNRKSKNKGKVTFALPRNDSKKKKKTKEDERLIEMLSSAQSKRLEDQRGVHVSPGELPSFLCEAPGTPVVVDEAVPSDTQTPHASMFDDVEAISGVGFLERGPQHSELESSLSAFASTPRDQGLSRTYGTPWSDKWTKSRGGERSFSQDGIVPSPREAEAYFRMSPVIVDSKSSVSKSLDFSSEAHQGRIFEDSSLSKSRLDGNISSHFNGSQGFRPVYLSGVHRAPVASPEKFSPESKKLRSSSDERFHMKMSPLPDKMSPNTRSSSASSNPSSLTSDTQAQISPAPSPPVSSHNAARLSNGMFLSHHQQQQSKQDKENQSNGMFLSHHQQLQAKQDKENQSNGEVLSHRAFRLSHQPTPIPAQRTTTRSQSSPLDFDPPARQGLTPNQQALLSPRFEHNPHYLPPETRPPSVSPHVSATASAQSRPTAQSGPTAHSRPTAPPPYYSSRGPPPHSTSGSSVHSALVSPRYNITRAAAPTRQYPRSVSEGSSGFSMKGPAATPGLGRMAPLSVMRSLDAEGGEEIVTFV